jgi:hyperosmotically inducible protein
MSYIQRSFAGAAVTLLIFPLISFAENMKEPVSPDSTLMNQQKLSAGEPSAQDQGNSKQDIELTKTIRQAIMKQKNFSTDAKNVKIISVSGVVTLQGPVKTQAEKKEIEKLAIKAAGNSKVISEIDIE